MRELFTAGAMLGLLLISFLEGCRTGDDYPYESKAGIGAIVYQLQTQFGMEASYSVIHMRYDDTSGLVLTTTGVAEGSDDLVVRQMKRGEWKQLSSESLRAMIVQPVLFPLDSISYLKKLPDLIRTSTYKLSQEIHEPGLHAREISIRADGHGADKDQIRINVYLHPEDGLETYEYSYNTAGLLKGVQRF